MKIVINIARILVGALFIFSGLVKAIDPLGLTYKMQEFFEVWGRDGHFPALMDALRDWALFSSIVMIVLEVALGVALLVGWRKKLTSWLLLLLIVFFTFLTSFVLFTGKITACGCFGDCIPLTPVQTFSKDFTLLLLVLLILFNQKYIQPLFGKWVPLVLVTLSVVLTTILQLHVMKHLPVVDCLPYNKGNDIWKLMQLPPDAVQPKTEIYYLCEKNGVKKEFPSSQYPDSTWTYVSRRDVVVSPGKNNTRVISDFKLMDSTGVDRAEDILHSNIKYNLFFVKELDADTAKWLPAFRNLVQKSAEKKTPIYIVAGKREEAFAFFNTRNQFNLEILECDVTVIKTAARAIPTLLQMDGSVVKNKFSWADLDEAVK